ncbi:hypothetical protein GCM10028862_10020 [Luteimonas pelagia]
MNTPTPHPTPTPDRSRRNRWLLVAIVLLFLLPIGAAWLINRGGLVPAPNRQHGELLQPPADLRETVPVRGDGTPYAWSPEARLWRVVALPSGPCEDACRALAADLDKVWRLLSHNADRVQVLWAGDWPDGVRAPDTLVTLAPDDRFRDALPDGGTVAGTPVYVIDPNGFVVLRYPPGFDPGGLRSDLARLVKLK